MDDIFSTTENNIIIGDPEMAKVEAFVRGGVAQCQYE